MIGGNKIGEFSLVQIRKLFKTKNYLLVTGQKNGLHSMAQGLKKGNKGRKKGKVSKARPRKRGRDGRIKGRVKGKTVGATTKPGLDQHLNNI